MPDDARTTAHGAAATIALAVVVAASASVACGAVWFCAFVYEDALGFELLEVSSPNAVWIASDLEE